ncbi:MAG TPA: hypothetical protein VKD72_03025, partial [Gemmataceae bacterium]|nr:hypothetical protein [Gemmataceae bacterium]
MELLLLFCCLLACAGLVRLLLWTALHPAGAENSASPDPVPVAPAPAAAEAGQLDAGATVRRRSVFAACALALVGLALCFDPLVACLAAYAWLAALLNNSPITGRRRVFLHWALALSTVWLLLNAPRDLGSLKSFLGWWAGFP